ncbi:hypothetical protein [Consotaella aegiceratis]|uniref:hypothetical protein n=1 Tax=Consotaella aegiceratis TaxID=3097961 RepID=UPI002F42A599
MVQIARGPKGERLRLSHDACGRLIERHVERDGFRPRRWRYAWDAHDRLASVTTPEGEEWLYRYDPFGRRVAKVRRFSGVERQRASWRWPSLVGEDGSPRAMPAAANDEAGASGAASDRPPVVGTAYLWDGDRMVAEAPLHLDGQIAWADGVRWHFEEETHKLDTSKNLAWLGVS